MKNKRDKIEEAKNSVKKQIKFLEHLLQELKRSEKGAVGYAVITIWCIDRYFSERLIDEVKRIILQNMSKDNEDEKDKVNV